MLSSSDANNFILSQMDFDSAVWRDSSDISRVFVNGISPSTGYSFHGEVLVLRHDARHLVTGR